MNIAESDATNVTPVDGPELAKDLEELARARAIVELAVEGIVTIDESGVVHSFNPAAEQIFGYDASEVIGRNVSMLMPSPDRERHDDYLGAYLETGVKKIIGIGREVVGLRKDGTTFPMDLAVSDVRHSDGRWFAGIIRDITQRRQSDLTLRKERDFIRAVLDTTAGLVVVLDPHGRIVRFNRSCEQLTGFLEEEVRGHSVWRFIPEDELAGVRQVFDALTLDKLPNLYENHWLTSDGSPRLISWSNTVMQTEEGEIEFVIATGVDVTDQRRAERQTAQQEKLAAVGQLASGIAHEIGNPLSSISAVTQTVLRKVDDGFVKEKLGLVGNHIDRISNIVRQMMDFARPPKPEWRLSSINDILSDAISIVRFDKRAKRSTMTFDLAEDIPRSYVMPDLINQVFINIALNGLDALETVGDDSPRNLFITTRATDQGRVRITFEDTGPGIPPDIVPRIMEPFFTTKDVGKGTGLGLAVSYRIVKEHGGDIRVEGRLGKGARFTLDLPLLESVPDFPVLS